MFHEELTMQFGSHIYGTNTPDSDLDLKTIFIPSPRSLLYREGKESWTVGTKKDARTKNTKDDTDRGYCSLKEYLRLLLEGNTEAVDILFTPRHWYQGQCGLPTWWVEVLLSKERFLHKGVTSFANYCKEQADKYGIKGSRVASLRAVKDQMELLLPVNPRSRIGDHDELWKILASDETAFIKVVPVANKVTHESGEKSLNHLFHLEVCGKMLPYTSRLDRAYEQVKKWFDEYGDRALQAEKNEGVDWKACMHAVRVGAQAKELLLTGSIQFPRPDANRLLKIRRGEIPAREVFEIIENGIQELQAASDKSLLRVTPDYEFAEELWTWHYAKAVSEKYYLKPK